MEIEIDSVSLEKRFLRYVKIDTQSAPIHSTYPSTEGQWTLLYLLKSELEALGLEEVAIDEYGYVMGRLAGRNCQFDAPSVGFLAHVDTSPDAPGAGVKPRIVESYSGGEIVLGNGQVLSPTESPELLSYVGQRLIVTDGTTLLGADDKAGVAAIVEALRYLSLHPEVSHAPLCIAFTPDEEIGEGVRFFDLTKFGATFAYTVDGGHLGELSYENFNAAGVEVRFRGINVHPGEAKGKMLNAARIAIEFDSLLGVTDRPETTEGREGFFHLHQMEGNETEAKLSYLIREFDYEIFCQRKRKLEGLATLLNHRYGADTVTVAIEDQYPNMISYLDASMHIVERAKEVFEEAGIIPDCSPIRGGTDGVRLTERGLPCPNLFAGGLNFHSVLEYLPVRSMAKASEVIVRLAHSFAGNTNESLCKKTQ